MCVTLAVIYRRRFSFDSRSNADVLRLLRCGDRLFSLLLLLLSLSPSLSLWLQSSFSLFFLFGGVQRVVRRSGRDNNAAAPSLGQGLRGPMRIWPRKEIFPPPSTSVSISVSPSRRRTNERDISGVTSSSTLRHLNFPRHVTLRGGLNNSLNDRD